MKLYLRSLGIISTAIVVTGLPQNMRPAHALMCESAKNTTERTICSNPQLKQIEELVSKTYLEKRAMLSPMESQEIERDQGMWQTFLQNCNTDENCIRDAFNQRLTDIQDFDKVIEKENKEDLVAENNPAETDEAPDGSDIAEKSEKSEASMEKDTAKNSETDGASDLAGSDLAGSTPAENTEEPASKVAENDTNQTPALKNGASADKIAATQKPPVEPSILSKFFSWLSPSAPKTENTKIAETETATPADLTDNSSDMEAPNPDKGKETAETLQPSEADVAKNEKRPASLSDQTKQKLKEAKTASKTALTKTAAKLIKTDDKNKQAKTDPDLAKSPEQSAPKVAENDSKPAPSTEPTSPLNKDTSEEKVAATKTAPVEPSVLSKFFSWLSPSDKKTENTKIAETKPVTPTDMADNSSDMEGSNSDNNKENTKSLQPSETDLAQNETDSPSLEDKADKKLKEAKSAGKKVLTQAAAKLKKPEYNIALKKDTAQTKGSEPVADAKNSVVASQENSKDITAENTEKTAQNKPAEQKTETLFHKIASFFSGKKQDTAKLDNSKNKPSAKDFVKNTGFNNNAQKTAQLSSDLGQDSAPAANTKSDIQNSASDTSVNETQPEKSENSEVANDDVADNNPSVMASRKIKTKKKTTRQRVQRKRVAKSVRNRASRRIASRKRLARKKAKRALIRKRTALKRARRIAAARVKAARSRARARKIATSRAKASRNKARRIAAARAKVSRNRARKIAAARAKSARSKARRIAAVRAKSARNKALKLAALKRKKLIKRKLKLAAIRKRKILVAKRNTSKKHTKMSFPLRGQSRRVAKRKTVRKQKAAKLNYSFPAQARTPKSRYIKNSCDAQCKAQFKLKHHLREYY